MKMGLFGMERSVQSSDEDIRQRIRERMRHGHLNMGSYSDDVDVRLWLPEMNGINVTMFCDRLISKYDEPDGYVFLITDKGDLNCLSVLNIEDQSSGFKLYKLDSAEDMDILVMEVDPGNIKRELSIPDDRWSGFSWWNKQPDCPIPSHGVSTERYNSKFILNFSVSGEFNLEIYYVPKGDDGPVWLFGKSFCCK